MNPTEIRAVALELLRNIAPEIEASTIDDAKPLRDQVDLDSMDWLNYLIALHDRLRVDIPEADYAKLVTLNDLTNYLVARVDK